MMSPEAGVFMPEDTMRPEAMIEGKIPIESLPPVGRHITRETVFPVTEPELKVIRNVVATRPDGKFLLRDSGPVYHDRLRSYLATELLGKVENPAVEVSPGETVDAWVGQRVGVAKSSEEALMMDANQGAIFLDRARSELGDDAIPLLKSIYRRGINFPTSNGEYKDLYSKCVRFLGRCIQDLSFRQGSEVRLSDKGQAYRDQTWKILEGSRDSGIVIPETVSRLEPTQTQIVLPDIKARGNNPWEKIKNYQAFLDSLNTRNRDGLELVAGITPLGLRKVFAPAFAK